MFLESISPLTNAEKIVSRLMVIHGKKDDNVPVKESQQLIKFLRANNLHFRYIEAHNEGHGFRHQSNLKYITWAKRQMLKDCLGL